MVRTEGVLALWNGLPPALARGLIYGGGRPPAEECRPGQPWGSPEVPLPARLGGAHLQSPPPVLHAASEQWQCRDAAVKFLHALCSAPPPPPGAPPPLPSLQSSCTMHGCPACHAGLRLGMYTPIKSAMAGDNSSIGIKVVAGTISGGVAAAISSPAELVKVRVKQL